MTDIERGSVEGFETFLEPDEITRFRDGVVWPVIDRVFGIDFRTRSIAGSSVIHGRTVVHVVTGELMTIGVEAECYDNGSKECPDEPKFKLKVSIEKERPDLKQEIIKASGVEFYELQVDIDEEDEDLSDEEEIDEEVLEAEEDGVAAWEVQTFIFDTYPRTRVPFDSLVHHELFDAEGEKCWSNQNSTETDIKCHLTVEEQLILNSLGIGLPQTMTSTDQSEIIKGLKLVGFIPRG